MKIATYLFSCSMFLTSCGEVRLQNETTLADQTLKKLEEPVTKTLPYNKYEGDTFGSTTFRDVMNHAVPFGEDVWRHLDTDEPAVNAHETLHAFPLNYRKVGLFFTLYKGKGRGYPLAFIPTTKSEVASLVPPGLVSLTSKKQSEEKPLLISYDVYFDGHPDQSASHLLYEWVCYIFDAKVSTELPKGKRSETANNFTFAYYAMTLFHLLEQRFPKYFAGETHNLRMQTYMQFKPVFRELIEESMRVHFKTVKLEMKDSKISESLRKHFLMSEESLAIRDSLKRTYGNEWFAKVFTP